MEKLLIQRKNPLSRRHAPLAGPTFRRPRSERTTEIQIPLGLSKAARKMHGMRDASTCTIAQKLDAARLSGAASRPREPGCTRSRSG
jgi:hypothetical protein